MEQNKSFNPNEPVTGQPYNPDTQPAAPYTQQAAPYTQPAAPDTQPAAPYTQQAAPYTQRTASYTQPAVENIQTETHRSRAETHPAKRIVSVIFSAIEIILGLRFILKLLGAGAQNSFVMFIYGITGFFVKLFEGIFSRVTINEASGAVFEPATLIAMVIIALIAWGVLKLMTPRTGSSVVKTDYTGPAGQNGQQK